MKGAVQHVVLWLGYGAIFALAIPATALLALIYGVSALVDRAAGDI